MLAIFTDMVACGEWEGQEGAAMVKKRGGVCVCVCVCVCVQSRATRHLLVISAVD
jgi:hypothetical protein